MATKRANWDEAISRLARDAEMAGFIVRRSGSQLTITRRHYATHRVRLGLCVCEDHTAYRLDVPLELCTAIRSVATMRKLLGL